MSDIEIVLASTSSSRRTMLEAAGVTFTVVAPNVDEDLMKDMLTGAAQADPESPMRWPKPKRWR